MLKPNISKLKHPLKNFNLVKLILTFLNNSSQINFHEYSKINKTFKNSIKANNCIVNKNFKPSNNFSYKQEIPIMQILKENNLYFQYVTKIEVNFSLKNGVLMNLKKLKKKSISNNIPDITDSFSIYISTLVQSKILVDYQKFDKNSYKIIISRQNDLILYKTIEKFKNMNLEMKQNTYLNEMSFKFFYRKYEIE